MPVHKLLPQPKAYGYEIGVLIFNLMETHAPGDTAHVGAYDYTVLMKVVEATEVTRVARGDALQSDDDLDRFIRETAATVYHACGTCAMGTGEGAVVDPEGRVIGVEGLRVADGSVMP